MIENAAEITPEILVAQDAYLDTFTDVLATRGLSEEVADSIFRSNNVPYLWAEHDDVDGAILLPPSWDSLLKEVHQVSDWSQETDPYIIKEVILGSFGGVITVESPLPDLQDESVLRLPDTYRKATKNLEFDVQHPYYRFGVRMDDDPNPQLAPDLYGEIGIIDLSIAWESHPLTETLINDLSRLMTYVSEQRENSELRIKKIAIPAEADAL